MPAKNAEVGFSGCKGLDFCSGIYFKTHVFPLLFLSKIYGWQVLTSTNSILEVDEGTV